YGTILLKGETIELRDVPKIIMSFFSWPFDAKYSRNERLHVLERHSFAYSRIRQCSNLNEKEKENLLNKYSQTITHDFTTKQGVNGEAIPNGNTIWLNRNFLNSNQEDEIAQTLIHEMMHCAGYNHIERRPTDRPGDNGEYYNSPPLRAELCIAGRQSDRN
ncbi:SprT-like domain-containing protein, partial [Bacillus inaquosorum]